MDASVIVPTHGRPESLAKCLARLADQTYEGTYEVVVFDDGSEREDIIRRVIEDSSVETISLLRADRSRGPAAARNRAADHALGDVLIFTDDDTLPESTWLEALLDRADEGYDVVEGRVKPPEEPRTLFSHAVVNETGGEYLTANMAYRREMFERIGGFCEQFPAAHREDSDLAFSAQEVGAQFCFEPNAVVRHPVYQRSWLDVATATTVFRYDPLLYRRHPERYNRDIRSPLELFTPVYLAAIIAGGVVSIGAILLLPLLAWFEARHYDYSYRLSSLPAFGLVRTASAILLVLSVLRGCIEFRVNPITLLVPSLLSE